MLLLRGSHALHRLADFRRRSETAASTRAKKTNLGSMPEWDLSDLYTAPDAPEVQRDLKKAAKEATRIKSTYQGRLAALAKDGGKLADRRSRTTRSCRTLSASSAPIRGFYYVLNQTDPERAKFNADVSEALTKIYTDLIFFELELNQIDDATIEAAAQAQRGQALQALARRSEKREAASARREARDALHGKSRRPAAPPGPGFSTRRCRP